MNEIGVVIPTYNRASTILRAINSVLASPRPDLELAVVDDCSQDESLELLRRLVDPRLCVDSMSSSGNANRARNRGVELTTSPILAFLDSDDEFLPGRIDRLIAFFRDNPDVDVLVDGFFVEHASRLSRFELPAGTIAAGDMMHFLVAHAIPITCSTIAMRRSAFQDVGGFDPLLKRHQDRDILLRLSARHRIFVGSSSDVIKHQSVDSFSRDAASYIAGLADLVRKHEIFTTDKYRPLVAYLVSRSIIHELLAGRFVSAYRVTADLHAAESLNVGLLAAILSYPRGKRVRRLAERKFYDLNDTGRAARHKKAGP